MNVDGIMTGLVAACCAAGFLIGGIPCGYFAGRLVLKDDIRKHGSGNIGATNVLRVLGWKWGLLVLVCDALKGLLPTWATGQIGNSQISETGMTGVQLLVGGAAILGHMFPVYLRFRGGKGVATALGVVLVISPQATLAAAGAFLLMVLLSRMVSLASIVASLAFCGTQLFLIRSRIFAPDGAALALFSVLLPGLIIFRHRANIRRILRGEESRLGKQKSVPEGNSATG